MGNDDLFEHTLTTTTRMLQSGAVLSDRFQIVRILGAGGMGVVYAAHDAALDATVAIKVIRSESKLGETALDRFRTEIRAARQVTHPNVVRTHDIGVDGDLVYLTMDLVDGRSLRERLADGPIDETEALAFTRDIARGLGAAHDAGIIHRDLKPDNILISDRGRALVSDFGVAAAAGEHSSTPAEIIGTPQYLSPEQARGDSPGASSDIYALGLVLIEMVTGKKPSADATPEATIATRAAGRTPWTAQLNALPARSRAIAARCLEENPADRFQHARDIAGTIDMHRNKASARRRGMGLAAGAAVFVAAAAIVLLTPVKPKPIGSTPPAMASDNDPSRSASSDPAPPRLAAVNPVEQRSAIAVLPLSNRTGDASLDWIETGLAESFTARLASYAGAGHVDADTDISADIGADISPVDFFRTMRTVDALGFNRALISDGNMRQLASLLNARSIIRGSLNGPAKDRTLELILRQYPDGQETRIEARIDDDGLMAAVDTALEKLVMRLGSTPHDYETPPLPENPEALAAYAQGVSLLTSGQSVKAIALLEKAVAEADQFAQGWSALATALNEAGYRDRAITAATRAVAILGKTGGRMAQIAEAEKAILSGDPETAATILATLVARFDNDAELKVKLAEQLGDLGRFSEAQALLTSVVESDANHPRAWFLRGKFSAITGDVKTALDDYYVRALIIQNRLDSAQGRGEVFNAMGIAHEQMGELDIARQYFINALEMRETAEDKRGAATSLSNLARLDMIEGDFAAAREALMKSRAALEAIGDRAGVASMLNELGLVEEETGDFAAALSRYREALSVRRDLGDALAIAESNVNIAFASFAVGELDNAHVFATAAYNAFDMADSARGRLVANEILGELALARGDWNGALAIFLANLDLAQETDNPFSRAVADGGLGQVARFQGHPQAALEAWDRALTTLEPLDDLRGSTEYTLRKADLLCTLGEADDAATLLAEVEEYLIAQGSVAQNADYHRLAGTVAVMQDRGDDVAFDHFSRAKEFSERSGSAISRLRVDIARAEFAGRNAARTPPGDKAMRTLSERAIAMGHVPLRLAALRAEARARLTAGDHDAAAEIAQSALRPPLGLEVWAGNWEFHEIACLALRAAGDSDPGIHCMAAADALSRLADQTPAPYRSRLLAMRTTDQIDVAAH